MKRPTPPWWSPQTATKLTTMILITSIAISSTTLSSAISASDQQAATTTVRPPQNQSVAQQEPPATMATNRSRTSRQRAPKRQPSSRSKTQTSLMATIAPQQQQSTYQDPLVLAQQEARIMAGYRNTPPVLVTHTRDLFVDVARHPLGARLATMKADDLDGDLVVYSLQPSVHQSQDASPYLTIGPQTGELRLAQRAFPVSQQQVVASAGASEQDCENEEDCSEVTTTAAIVADTNQRRRPTGSKIYSLNVMVSDGQYNTTTEFLVHVFNSTLLATQNSNDSSDRSGDIDQLEGILQQKTEEFYNRLLIGTNKTGKLDQDPYSEQVPVIYPNYVNPSLVRPELPIAPQEEFTTQTPAPTSTNQPIQPDMTGSLVELSNQLGKIQPSATPAESKSADYTTRGAHLPEPMMVSMVIVCSCFLIVLVLLLFLVPLSVKRLRRRIKHVERQHEQLSQKNSSSAGSSIMCHSTLGGSAGGSHCHQASLSEFAASLSTSGLSDCCKSTTTMDRAKSVVCRQSSLDSTTQRMAAAVNVTNPVYLRDHQHQHHQHDSRRMVIQNQAFLMMPPAEQRQFMLQPAAPILVASNHHHGRPLVDNIYCPIEDEFYSTIGTESTNLEQVGQFGLEQPNGRDAQSPTASDSGSSTRSLARFLSLPARHSAHQATQQGGETPSSNKTLEDLDDIFRPQQQPPVQPAAFKTIARSSQVAREQRQAKLNDALFQNEPTNWELERHRLKFLKILDEGQFGFVWRCKLKSPGGEQTVAVKTLKNGAGRGERARDELLTEIDNMKLVYGHPNVVKILHCCTESEPILLVMEYVELGKLQSFLENSRLNHRYATNLYNNMQAADGDHLTSRDLVKFIYHVAKGMEFVAHQGIVHRDLASRNVLVSGQRICKIGDFGMARNMAGQSNGIYERHSKDTKIPVRWMAPEVLLNNTFTTKSDVYSFGILMWEIVTLGSTPYRHLKTEQVIEEVARRGQRPAQPEYCHKLLFEIMSKCWQSGPELRPTFSRLVKQLDELLLSANDYIELDQYPDHNYYNIPKTVAPYELL